MLSALVLVLCFVHSARMNYRRFVVAALAVLCLLARTGFSAGESRVLVGADYLPAVRETIEAARESVDVQMYFIIMRPAVAQDPVGSLVHALIAAHRRGVAVQVVIEEGQLMVARKTVEPERKLPQVDGQRIHIDPINAVPGHQAPPGVGQATPFDRQGSKVWNFAVETDD